tara:strand:+ start:300 stop:1100 length:801 start_codon:yes stop_codon:yes gene_type:complete
MPESEAWWNGKYANRASIEKYLGNTQPFLVEILAVRIWQMLNGDVSLDWGYQSCSVATLRSIAPGLRVSYVLTGIYIFFLSFFVLEEPLLLKYDLVSPQPTMRFGNVTVAFAMFLWSLDFATLCYGWLLVARTDGLQLFGSCCLCFSPPVKRERKNSTNACTDVVLGATFFLFFLVNTLATHTILAHVYSARNVWFAALLGLQTVMVLLASLGDLCSIGSPWGIGARSHMASILLSFRGLFLVPLTVIWSISSIVAAFPPSYCETC